MEPKTDPIVNVRMQVTTWIEVLNALNDSTDKGNYLAASAYQAIVEFVREQAPEWVDLLPKQREV